MIVSEAMTRDPITIDPEAPLGTALDAMRSNKLRHLPVVDEDGRLMGIVTDRDLRHALLAPAVDEYLSASGQRRFHQLGRTLEDLRVRDVMTWGVVTTGPTVSLAHAALILVERGLGSLPVISDGRLVGILTERDILHAVSVGKRVTEFDPDGYLW
jgi:acetoin utilization protein AcuB